MNPIPTLRQWSLMTSSRACSMPSGGAVPVVACVCAAAYCAIARAKAGQSPEAHSRSKPATSP
tara:strand:+ start:395 stop:583 length:189 start_codon:yes stop_codon:yes gene_type:complete